MRIGILCLALLSIHVNAETLIEVFSDHPMTAMNIPHAKIIVYDLSQLEKVKARAPEFPPDQQQAEKLARAWFDSPAGKAYVNNLKFAYTGHGKLYAYKIAKVPAIVFESGKYVVYGTTDIGLAVSDYDQFIRSQQKGDH